MYWRYWFLFFAVSFCGISLEGRAVSTPPDSLALSNYTFDPQIHSVKFHQAGFPLTLPILQLYANLPVVLSFDDFSEEVRRFYYTIVQCTYDWRPTDMSESEYLGSYTDGYIDDYDFSFNTFTSFTHYELPLPNDEIQITRSGNYVLQVYDEDGETLLLSRRFMVVEPMMDVHAQMVMPRMVSDMDSRQELVFSVEHPELEIRNPQVELKATVLQNNRWDNAVIGARARVFRPDREVYDTPGQFSFEAGKEFRNLDLRSFRSASGRVADIRRYPDGYEITLHKDYKRYDVARDYADANGGFIIETFDFDNNDLESDYADVLFALYSPTEYENYDVYIFGELSEFQIKPEFRMAYNNLVNGYVAEVELKQGFYNYYYVLVPKAGGRMDISRTEGSWRSTENIYTILVYYRPFGERYDRLVAVGSVSSR